MASVPVLTFARTWLDIQLRMLEPKGYWQVYDASAALDLTFAMTMRRPREANVKSAALVRGSGTGAENAMKVIGLAGWSGAGKTTLLARVIPHLRKEGLRVS